MNCLILLLLLCCGNNNNRGCGGSNNNCDCDNCNNTYDRSSRRRNRRDDELCNSSEGSPLWTDDCSHDDNRSSATESGDMPRSNYPNLSRGETCGCEGEEA